MRHLIAISLVAICAAALAPRAGAHGSGAKPLTNQDIIRLLKDEKLTAEQMRERLTGGATDFDLSEV